MRLHSLCVFLQGIEMYRAIEPNSSGFREPRLQEEHKLKSKSPDTGIAGCWSCKDPAILCASFHNAFGNVRVHLSKEFSTAHGQNPKGRKARPSP